MLSVKMVGYDYRKFSELKPGETFISPWSAKQLVERENYSPTVFKKISPRFAVTGGRRGMWYPESDVVLAEDVQTVLIK